RYHIDDTAKETERFHKAKKTAFDQLGELYQTALTQVGETNAAIFEVHQMMLDDEDYIDSIINIITAQNLNAEYAIAKTSENFEKMFAAMDDDYMKERAADVKDISARLIRILGNEQQAIFSPKEPVILAADDLTPSETVQLDKSKILAFATVRGSVNSHTAILARTMNIPAIIGLSDLTEEYDGKEVIIDGFTGILYIEPDIDTHTKLLEKHDAYRQQQLLLSKLKGKENKTADGQTIRLYANIGNESDVKNVLENDAGGIGLLRSEFLYLQAEDYPTESELFSTYKLIAELMGGKKVIVRTLDIGADKQAHYFNLPKEENPAMGYRAIRICLDRPEIFITQLRALYRASAFGNISIMFPMITSLEEITRIKEIIKDVKSQLDKEGTSYADNVEIGIMIETPASVMISDLLAEQVDFFSIGTNDLTQYTLAIDRQNPLLDQYYNSHHRGLLRMIQIVAENAHKKGIWVGICGELASDLSLTETFLALEIDELSVSPSFILPLRDKIRNCDVTKTKSRMLANI
ncbi:MAG: phosphoenolpyruvate--protein phosphotransferase, partial [Lachnoclostridium sp.]|nr:phosphoenolpyruvate--protein phosphotransferase [Lachnoclostridium sp.]